MTTKSDSFTKVWHSEDGDLRLVLIADSADCFDLSVDNVDEDEFCQLASDTEQLEEIIQMLMTAKDTLQRRARGEKIASDSLPQEYVHDSTKDEEGEEEEEDEDEEDE